MEGEVRVSTLTDSPKRRLFLAAAMVFLAVFSLSVAAVSDAPGALNFSGTYSSEISKHSKGPESSATLEVVQTDDAVEITRVEAGKRTTSRCPFNGSTGPYTTSGRVSGTCKAEIKGKSLIVESLVTTHPETSSTPVRIHTKERWQLSTDSQVLTIKSDSDFPDVSAAISSAIGASFVERFRRAQTQ